MKSKYKLSSVIEFLLKALVAIALIAITFYPKWHPNSAVCSSEFANFGQWLSGIVSLVSVPLLLATIYLQARTMANEQAAKEEEDREKSFERHCKSIEVGLSHISNRANNIQGGAAIIRYGNLCEEGIVDFHTTIRELPIEALKAVIAALSDLLDWVRLPKNNFIFHNYFRVRFMSLILAFEKIMPAEAHGLTEQQLFSQYGNNNDQYSLLLAIHRLKTKEFEVWTEYLEAQESTRNEE